MRRQFLAGAIAVALATWMTTGATAHRAGGSHGGGGGGGVRGSIGGLHGGLGGFRGSYGAMHRGRGAFAGPGLHGGRRFGYGYGDDGGWGYVPYSGYCSPFAIDSSYCGSSYVIGW